MCEKQRFFDLKYMILSILSHRNIFLAYYIAMQYKRAYMYNNNNKYKEIYMTNDYTNPFDFFDYQKFLSAVKLPAAGSNEQATAGSKKTLEAYAGASKAIYEGFNTFAKKQVEILNSAIANAKEAGSDLTSGKPQDNAAKSIALTKQSIEAAQANVSDLVKIYEKTANETFAILNSRFLEGLSELQDVAANASNKASAPLKK